MASMFDDPSPNIILLDAGAGVGSLSVAFVADMLTREPRPKSIHVVAYELDDVFAARLAEAMTLCREECRGAGVAFSSEIRRDDFIESASGEVGVGLFGSDPKGRFTHAILNPPYKKISTDSDHRRQLSAAGIETTNLYTAFLALAALLLVDRAQMVAITPRSYCNGPYFRPFREHFLARMAIDRVHVFNSRKEAFSEDDVLQENIIIRARKTTAQPASVVVSSSNGPSEEPESHELRPEQLVNPNDPEKFIHVVADGYANEVSDLMGRIDSTLDDIGLKVSTGRIVDFRSREWLKQDPEPNTVPLIYPMHFRDGWVAWPRDGKKPNAFVANDDSEKWLIPAAVYVLTKRFSAKEEKRRIVAAIFDPARVPCERVAFENHVNYFHARGEGLPIALAKGLAAYLNSTLVDSYFRNFNGHTQVNAGDLKNLRYPSRQQLERLGGRFGDELPPQNEIDHIIGQELLDMGSEDAGNPFTIKQRIDEALTILRALGMPKAQQNERSALTLLSLLDLKPADAWPLAKSPLMGITPMMDWFAAHYAKKYAPNSRETVRRFTIHQFEQAGIVVKNPDQPRAVNSPDNVYQIETSALELLKTFGTDEWEKSLATYLGSLKTLQQRYAAERDMQRLPVTLPNGGKVELTVGGQNVLIKEIIEQFCPHYTPGGEVVYIGDAGDKFIIFEREHLATLGVVVDEHGIMPDVVVYHKAKKWLILIEAVTSHGPVDPKRHANLKELFKGSKVGLVFVTAFLDRKGLNKYLGEIAWETEVWVAESPTHLIHFNGERFLGPYDAKEST
jgi:adenine-specific DNA-methyltransferase